MARILAHPIGGGYDLRHEGCAPKCCEAEALPLTPMMRGIVEGPKECGLCCGLLTAPPIHPGFEFDRDARCEAHEDAYLAEHPPCGRGGDCEGVGICPDCSGLTL